ncbi:gustatory and pheromone receptor 39a-like [Haematobia irritans]|uniref:gustatory and pheromone receptor 39a-like n=1 Tax=Haematobia irritans TaxID=7368 RepID=UPI003F50B1DE
MSYYPELYLHIKTLNFFGLICCDCHLDGANNNVDIARGTNYDRQAKSIFCFIQLMYNSLLLYCIIRPKDFYLAIFTETGNLHSIFLFGSSCILISCIYGYFYVTHAKNVSFLKDILIYYNDMYNKGAGGQVVKACRRQFFLYAAISLITFLISTFSYVANLKNWPATLFLIILHSSITSVVGIIISIYATIVKIFTISMRHLNGELIENKFGGTDNDFKNIVKQQNRLLGICHQGLNRRFGIVLIMTCIYLLIFIPSGPYLVISRILNIDISQDIMTIIVPTIVTCFWSMPWIVIIIMMFKCGGLTVEGQRRMEATSGAAQRPILAADLCNATYDEILKYPCQTIHSLLATLRRSDKGEKPS